MTALLVTIGGPVAWLLSRSTAGRWTLVGVAVFVVLESTRRDMVTRCCFGPCSGYVVANPYRVPQAIVLGVLLALMRACRRARPRIHGVMFGTMLWAAMLIVATNTCVVGMGDTAALALCETSLYASCLLAVCMVLAVHLADREPRLPRALAQRT